METLARFVQNRAIQKAAIGHFNISDAVTLWAVFNAAREVAPQQAQGDRRIPLIIGASEGERDFLGTRQAVALVRSIREEYNHPIFINADHTHSLAKVKEAVAAGFDAILFDGGKLPLAENIRQTKEVVEYVKSKNPDILVEGELGYIGGSSEVLKEIPEGAAIEEKDLTSPEDAARFVKETGVDLLAPAVGNLHGMFANAPNPRLNIERTKRIQEAVKIPLVLHGGSGISDEDFIASMQAGVSIIHISTELRRAWRAGAERGLRSSPDEVSPYKLMKPALDEMKKVAYNRLKLFTRE